MFYINNNQPSNSWSNIITSKAFDSTWIEFNLTDSHDYKVISGLNKNSIYTVKVSRHYTNWRMSVCDFVLFHEALNKKILLNITQQDFIMAKNHYGRHQYNDNFLREYEPKVLVHSTTYDNWNAIKEDGYLRSLNILRKDYGFAEEKPIGKDLGDPDDFSDYIMFSNGEVSGELIVLSKQQGKIVMNQEMEYETGARMYFDAKKIAEAGLLVRDGVHLKVKNELHIAPYLLWTATWKDIGLPNSISTPIVFSEESNYKFKKLFPNYT